ncbi:MAG: ABC transporter ATP-binding protein [Phycisphaerae bacterium]
MAATGEPLLEVDDVFVTFDSLRAVDGVSLKLHAGELLGLLGPNGAGKTTLLRAACGLQPIDSGQIRLHGETLDLRKREMLSHVGFTPDVPPVHEQVTVRTFLRMVARGYGDSGAEVDERIDFWLEKVWLTEKADQKIKALSRGMRQRIGLARTLLPNPSVVLLDEPAAGLDPAGRVQFRKLLTDLRNQGKAIIVSSHILADMPEYCSHIAIMAKGSVLRAGTVDQILAGGDAHATEGAPAMLRFVVELARPVHNVRQKLLALPGVVEATLTDPDGRTLTLSTPAGRAEAGAATAEAPAYLPADITPEPAAEPAAESAARLLSLLVAAGLPVASFKPATLDLEAAYLAAGVGQVD